MRRLRLTLALARGRTGEGATRERRSGREGVSRRGGVVVPAATSAGEAARVGARVGAWGGGETGLGSLLVGVEESQSAGGGSGESGNEIASAVEVGRGQSDVGKVEGGLVSGDVGGVGSAASSVAHEGFVVAEGPRGRAVLASKACRST